MSEDIEEIEIMLNDCAKRIAKLNMYEKSFLQGICDQMADKGSLSSAQLEKLNSIWDKATS